MKPLFEEVPEKEKTILDFESKLSRIGYSFTFVENEMIGAGTLIKLFPTGFEYDYELVIPWVRPAVITMNQFDKILADYPRLNVPKQALHLSDEDKINFMSGMINENRLHFLIIIPRPNSFSDFYWFGRYSKVFPSMRLTYREKGKDADRLCLGTYSTYNFCKLIELKTILDKNFAI